MNTDQLTQSCNRVNLSIRRRTAFYCRIIQKFTEIIGPIHIATVEQWLPSCFTKDRLLDRQSCLNQCNKVQSVCH